MSTAKDLIENLSNHIEEKEKEKLQKFYKGGDPKTTALGVRFGTVFKIAKDFINLSLDQVEELLENDHYEVRMASVSVLDFKARSKKTRPEQKQKVYELYLRRHDRIDNWDLVDRAATYVVGSYLFDKDRAPLYRLAESKNVWERRTALYANFYFIKQGQITDAVELCQLLVSDNQEYIQKAVGTILREIGKKDEDALLNFLQSNLSDLASITFSYATEKLDRAVKAELKAARNSK